MVAVSKLGMIGWWTMSVMPIARLAAALVVAGVPLAAATAAPPSLPAAPPLEALAATLGDLKASLSAIREQMVALRAPPDGAAPPPPPPACALGAAAAESGPSAWQHAKVAMTAELVSTRERLAAAEAAAASLQTDRQRLVRRITELDQMLAKARTSEVVDGLVEQRRMTLERVEPEPSGAPDDSGEMSAIAAPELLRVARPALAGEAHPVLPPTERRDLARAGKRLDQQAELALAQLRIAELSTALQAARLRQEAMAAEVTTLRSLTDGQIERFMGHAD
jgi:hypothetical protein